jgi:hypothetical protein
MLLRKREKENDMYNFRTKYSEYRAKPAVTTSWHAGNRRG